MKNSSRKKYEDEQSYNGSNRKKQAKTDFFKFCAAAFIRVEIYFDNKSTTLFTAELRSSGFTVRIVSGNSTLL